MRPFLAEIESRTSRFRQEEHPVPEQRYCGFAGGASTGFDPPHGLLRAGARRLIEAAVTAEFEAYVSGFAEEKRPGGRRGEGRDGHLDASIAAHHRYRGHGLGRAERSKPDAPCRTAGLIGVGHWPMVLRWSSYGTRPRTVSVSSVAVSTSPMPSGPSSIRTGSSRRIAAGTTAEDRCRLVGTVDGRVYVVVYTVRGSAVRIISARKANRKEVADYEHNAYQD